MLDGLIPHQPDGARRVVLARHHVELRTLSRTRHAVLACLTEQLTDDRASDYLLAIGEVAANVIQHGGGSGELVLWKQRDCLVCELRDHGVGFAEVPAATAPVPANGGWGMVIARQLCDRIEIDSGTGGATVRLLLYLP